MPSDTQGRSGQAARSGASVPGAAIERLFGGRAVGVTRWRCLHTDPTPGPEQCQSWNDIVFVHAGSFLFSSEGRHTLADPVSVVLMNAFVPYTTSHPLGCGDHGSALVVAPELLDRRLEELGVSTSRPERAFVGLSAPLPPRVLLAQHLLVRSLQLGALSDSVEVEERAVTIADLALAAGCRPQARRRRRGGRVSTARNHAEAVKFLLVGRCREPLRLPEIAAAVGVSPFYLCRVFRQEIGIPMHRYLNRLRLREALEAVADGATDLTALALALGFSSHSHLTAAFRREFGLPPSAARSLSPAQLRLLARQLAAPAAAVTTRT